MSKTFCIAGVAISINSDTEIADSDEFAEFFAGETSDMSEQYDVTFQETLELSIPKGEPFQKLMGVDVYKAGENELVRVFREERDKRPAYAIQFCDWERREIMVFYLRDGIRNINHIGGAFFHVAWEDILLRERRLILHACCVETEFGGILFSGNSGIGKSTQGELWCRYEGAKLINGDRPILYRQSEMAQEPGETNILSKWFASGSPYAGSSRCHINQKTKVRAIVMLKQAKECTLRRLEQAEAFQKIFAQMTISSLNTEYTVLACDLAEQLVKETTVYELSCTPDYAAVEILKDTLSKELQAEEIS